MQKYNDTHQIQQETLNISDQKMIGVEVEWNRTEEKTTVNNNTVKTVEQGGVFEAEA